MEATSPVLRANLLSSERQQEANATREEVQLQLAAYDKLIVPASLIAGFEFTVLASGLPPLDASADRYQLVRFCVVVALVSASALLHLYTVLVVVLIGYFQAKLESRATRGRGQGVLTDLDSARISEGFLDAVVGVRYSAFDSFMGGTGLAMISVVLIVFDKLTLSAAPKYVLSWVAPLALFSVYVLLQIFDVKRGYASSKRECFQERLYHNN